MEEKYINFTNNIKKFDDVYNQIVSENKKDVFNIKINGDLCLTKYDLLKEFSLKLKFPNYFSYNWDSFDECLNDLEWLESSSFIIAIKNSEKLLANNNDALVDFYEILLMSINDWREGVNSDGEAVQFTLIIHSNQELPRIIESVTDDNSINRF